MHAHRIHHVAYVVADLDAAIPHFVERYGMSVEVREVMTAQGVEAAALGVGPGQVELIQPLDSDLQFGAKAKAPIIPIAIFANVKYHFLSSMPKAADSNSMTYELGAALAF